MPDMGDNGPSFILGPKIGSNIKVVGKHAFPHPCKIPLVVFFQNASSENASQLLPLMTTNVSSEAFSHILAICKLSLHPIAFWFEDSEDESFKFLQMGISDCEIDAEPVPGIVVPISQMAAQAGSKVNGKAYVLEFPVAIESVHSVSPPDVLADNTLIFLKS